MAKDEQGSEMSEMSQARRDGLTDSNISRRSRSDMIELKCS